VGVLLAGGRGRRLGADKASAELAGRPLVQWAWEAVRAAVAEVAVVAKPDTPLPELPGTAIWREPAEPRHPLAGVGPTHLLVRWVDSQGQATRADYTHNEYLQLAAEDGVVAPVLVAGALVVVGVALARRRSDWLAAGALGGRPSR